MFGQFIDQHYGVQQSERVKLGKNDCLLLNGLLSNLKAETLTLIW